MSNLTTSEPKAIEWTATLSKKNVPWFAIIVPDHDLAKKRELNGRPDLN